MRLRWVHVAAAMLIAFAATGAFWQPYPPGAVDMLAKNLGPSLPHPFGTDHLGRDLASRMMEAAGRSLLVVALVALIGFLGGMLTGSIAALLGGWRERLLLRAAEMFIVLPTLIWALVAGALFGLNPLTAGLALGLAGLGPMALTANSLTHRTLGLDYIRAARALGVTRAGLLRRHVLPAILPLLSAQAGAQAGQAVVAYAGLAFLGLGVDPSRPDWGAMLFEYRMFIFETPRLMLIPGLGIATMALIINLLADPPK
ncbi:ABC transporter permease [Paracoccus aminophilus]|uniref:ABC-type dipeptide/oligopeptide/nickel transport systems, permease component n=1 Tax=Paracoccus aminophilus JCM 7686 TaxID=1367847 RepID=S5YZI4_PARAH|nr:ABC transporter permease [Paracoccus aminophilus]AGT10621.1 ABC-type dipeptide/oligopeptide/nickel transport systems, permease component [Paracoccus aminophilus JCM 7686]